LAAGTPAAAESEGLGALGWTLLILLVVALAGGWLLWRSRKRSAWDAQAAALEADVGTATRTQNRIERRQERREGFEARIRQELKQEELAEFRRVLGVVAWLMKD